MTLTLKDSLTFLKSARIDNLFSASEVPKICEKTRTTLQRSPITENDQFNPADLTSLAALRSAPNLKICLGLQDILASLVLFEPFPHPEHH